MTYKAGAAGPENQGRRKSQISQANMMLKVSYAFSVKSSVHFQKKKTLSLLNKRITKSLNKFCLYVLTTFFPFFIFSKKALIFVNINTLASQLNRSFM